MYEKMSRLVGNGYTGQRLSVHSVIVDVLTQLNEVLVRIGLAELVAKLAWFYHLEVEVFIEFRQYELNELHDWEGSRSLMLAFAAATYAAAVAWACLR